MIWIIKQTGKDHFDTWPAMCLSSKKSKQCLLGDIQMYSTSPIASDIVGVVVYYAQTLKMFMLL